MTELMRAWDGIGDDFFIMGREIPPKVHPRQTALGGRGGVKVLCIFACDGRGLLSLGRGCFVASIKEMGWGFGVLLLRFLDPNGGGGGADGSVSAYGIETVMLHSQTYRMAASTGGRFLRGVFSDGEASPRPKTPKGEDQKKRKMVVFMSSVCIDTLQIPCWPHRCKPCDQSLSSLLGG